MMEKVKKLVIQIFDEIEGCCEYCRCAMESIPDSDLSTAYREAAASKIGNAARLTDVAGKRMESQSAGDQNLKSVWDILFGIIDRKMRNANAMLSSLK
jgi:hypothetical protein